MWAGAYPISDNPEDYVFFLSKEDIPYGCFSNAYRESGGGHVALSKLTAHNSRFWCVNQELHYMKAIAFGDNETAQQIIQEENDAGKIKQLGRMVRGYDDNKWTELRYDVARDAVFAKFSHDNDIKKILLDTGDKIIVEAASDKAWGIGCLEFSSDDTKGAKNKQTCTWDVSPQLWEGQNLLGRCLMDVRRMLREN
jgi:ribA/ribD-fused uncharacterized protein